MIPSSAYFNDPHKFNVEGQAPPLNYTTGSGDWHFLMFFDQPTPAEIGYRASASAYSREVLAAAFNTHIDELPTVPFTPADPLVVGRVNPVDAHGISQA